MTDADLTEEWLQAVGTATEHLDDFKACVLTVCRDWRDMTDPVVRELMVKGAESVLKEALGVLRGEE